MSNARATALFCACALVANAIAIPAPPVNTKKCDHKETKMLKPEKTIVVRRVPIAYFYPFSLWPVPKYPPRDRDDPRDMYHFRGNQKNTHVRKNKR